MLELRQDSRIGRIGILQVQQVGHFVIDVDAACAVEALLQRIDDDILSLAQALRRRGGGALGAQHLADVGRKRAGVGRRRGADAGLGREGEVRGGELAREEIRPRRVAALGPRLIGDEIGRRGVFRL